MHSSDSKRRPHSTKLYVLASTLPELWKRDSARGSDGFSGNVGTLECQDVSLNAGRVRYPPRLSFMRVRYPLNRFQRSKQEIVALGYAHSGREFFVIPSLERAICRVLHEGDEIPPDIISLSGLTGATAHVFVSFGKVPEHSYDNEDY